MKVPPFPVNELPVKNETSPPLPDSASPVANFKLPEEPPSLTSPPGDNMEILPL